MSARLEVHPVDPQPRLIARAAAALQAGGLALCPTDAGYALVWMLEARDAEYELLPISIDQGLGALTTKHL